MPANDRIAKIFPDACHFSPNKKLIRGSAKKDKLKNSNIEINKAKLTENHHSILMVKAEWIATSKNNSHIKSSVSGKGI